MKFSTITFSLTLLSSASAFCTFRLKVANSVNTDLNGLYVQSLNGVATLGPPFTDITAEFPDPQIITDSTLISTGAPGDGNGKFTLESSLGVERIVFADIPPPGVRIVPWRPLSCVSRGADSSTYTGAVYGLDFGTLFD